MTESNWNASAGGEDGDGAKALEVYRPSMPWQPGLNLDISYPTS
jgi:hypothetical protein